MGDRLPDHDAAELLLRKLAAEMGRMKMKVAPGQKAYTVGDAFALAFRSMTATIRAHREFTRIEAELAEVPDAE